MKYKLILTTILLGLFGHVSACKCGGTGTVKGSFKSADLIIYGKVISKELVSFQETIKKDKIKEVKESLKYDTLKLKGLESPYIYKIELEVIKKYKGGQIKNTLTIFTAMNSASCGYKFQINKLYIIYASKKSDIAFFYLPESERKKELEKENAYWTNMCTRTTEYNKSEDNELTKLMSE